MAKTRAAVEAEPSPSAAGEYVVVARRYRPQLFEELVGQEHVAKAMANAISTNRVGHAYLFTGARGVGKTSAARILAKALNCLEGTSPTPCNRCEICQAISTGDDVDVLEIDGASNRRIEEMRNLRQNVNIRPSRTRFKIYIIDEVHMLTNEAFNALLKTLEEPPEHVKFIFCTTEPEKIPITILSRCQRFDFAGIQAQSIAERLAQICQTEGVTAEAEALEILARRAAGSMRDSQSLLEQLLAFGGTTITAADVHAMLGTAGDGRLGKLVNRLVQRDAAAALAALDEALLAGVDAGQLLDQLLGFFRDIMTATVGCPPQFFMHAGKSEQAGVAEAAKTLGVETVLAILQILDQTLGRLRYSTQRRILVELALVRICALAELTSVDNVLHQAKQIAASTPTDAKKKVEPELTPPVAMQSAMEEQARTLSQLAKPHERPETNGDIRRAELIPERAREIWNRVAEEIGGLVAAGEPKSVEIAPLIASHAISGPNRLVVTFPATYTSTKELCEHPDQAARLEQAISVRLGQAVKLEYRLAEAEPATNVANSTPKTASNRLQIQEKSLNPLVKRAGELFNATIVRVFDE